MKRIFITGISGLLGTNLANQLIERGYIITAILRDPERYKGKKSGNLRLIKMGLWDNYIDYLHEIDIVIHIAAETATDLLYYQDYEKVNYDASVRLFETAQQQQVKQFIYISTANTIGFGNAIQPGDETTLIKKPFADLYYAQSKLKAEKYLQNYSGTMKVTILNPTFMLGAYDSKPSSGKIISMSLKRKILFYPPGGKNFVAVKDVVHAVIQSFDKQMVGERYLICGENISYKSFFQRLNKIADQKQLLIPVPAPVLFIMGVIGNMLRFFRFRTSLSITNMRILSTRNYYSNEKSREVLKVKYSPVDEAIREAVDYFQLSAQRR